MVTHDFPVPDRNRSPDDRSPDGRSPDDQRTNGRSPDDQRTNDRSPDDTGCFERAKRRGQATFTLVEQDASSPVVIVEWIKQNVMTAPAAKLRKALDAAIEMREYPRRKLAD